MPEEYKASERRGANARAIIKTLLPTEYKTKVLPIYRVDMLI